MAWIVAALLALPGSREIRPCENVEVRDAARLRSWDYRKAYVLSDEQRERYKDVA